MARFLSPEWFGEVWRYSPEPPGGEPMTERPDLVLEQVVRGTLEGEVRYRVVVSGGVAYIRPTTAGPPDLTISCEWATAVGLAQGRLSAHAALMEGRLRIKGNLARLSGRAVELVGLDPVPAEVRLLTTY